MRKNITVAMIILLLSNHSIGQIITNINKKQKNEKLLFSTFVDEQIKQWETKEEFEKTLDWKKRVNEKTRREKIEDLKVEAIDAYAKKIHIRLGFCYIGASLRLGSYDADKEVYTIMSRDFGDIPVPVPFAEAKRFGSTNRCDDSYDPKKVVYFILNDKLALASATFITYEYDGEQKKYVYENPLAKNRKLSKKEINWQAEEFTRLAKQNFSDENYQLAINNYEKAISLNPGINISWARLAKAYFAKKNYEKVISSYLSYQEVSKDNRYYKHAKFDTYIIAKSHFELKNYSKAIELFNDFLHSERLSKMSEAIIYSNIGECYVILGNLENGNQNYEKAINLLKNIIERPHYVNDENRAYYNLGNIYKSIGDDKKATKAYKKAAKLGNKDAQFIINIK